jgi:23S rRNA (guanosine2251-2'-O)-methyltransferase
MDAPEFTIPHQGTMRSIVLIAHNLRSTHNVGSLLRTAEGLGVQKVCLTGYTPYPAQEHDFRLPHESRKIDAQIRKTALGAEQSQAWEYWPSIDDAIASLKQAGYTIAALEQTPHSVPLPDYAAPDNIALIVGREVEGVEPEVLALTDVALEIPMAGQKESFNVAQAAAMALYDLALVTHSVQGE